MRKEKTHRIHFRHSAELIDYVKDTPAENHSRSYPPSDRFCQYSFDETLEHLRAGWKGPTEEMVRIKERISSMAFPKGNRLDVEYDTNGDWIDIDTYLKGEPECFGKITITEGIRDTIVLLVNATAAWTVEQKTILTRGAALISLIEKLQEAYDVELIVGSRGNTINENKGVKENIEISVSIDLQNEFSRDCIAFFVAHPGFLRRLEFAVEEKILKRPDNHKYSYGSCAEICDTQSELSKTGKRYYYFPALMYSEENRWLFIEAAVERIKEIMSEIKNGTEATE